MMGRTEERFRDAATALGSTLRPADIPPLRLPETPGRRRTRRAAGLTARPPRPRRLLVPLAALASVAVVIGLIAAVRGLSGPGRPSPGPVTGAGSWRISKVVTGQHVAAFSAVAVTGPASAWAFAIGSTSAQPPVAWRLSGSAWTRVPFPGQPGDQVDLAGASSPANVWTTTAYNHLVRWDGRKWAVVTGPPAAPVTGVAVISPSDVWMFGLVRRQTGTGPAEAWHYDGRSWSLAASGHGLTEASPVAGDDIWAAGTTVLARWNGSRWQRWSVAALLPRIPGRHFCSPTLTGVYGVSATDAWAVGWARCQDTGGPGVLLHYVSGTWHRVARLSEWPVTVIPDGRGGLWIPLAPGWQATRGRGLMDHYSDGALSSALLPVPPGQLQFAGAAATPDGREVLAVGGRLRHGSSGRAGLVFRYRP